jgi:hypothetical protein
MRHCLVLVALLAAACAESAGAMPAGSGPGSTASAPAFHRDDPPASAMATAAPREEAAPVTPASAPPPEEPPPPAHEPAPPDVEVKNVGMHIGGEENTAEQKRPIREAVAAHYDAMRRCWAQEADAARAITFGIDIRIDGAGGRPKISNPRSGFKNGEVSSCLQAIFEAIEFPAQPNKQARMVSFSIEFRKK